MSAPYWDIESKVEEAFKTAISANVTPEQLNGAVVLTGLEAEDITSGHRVVCECQRTRGQKGTMGNVFATVAVVVRTKCNPKPRSNVKAQHRARVAYVRDFLMDDTLPDILSAAVADFTCQGILTELTTEQGREEVDPLTGKGTDHFLSTMTMDILCFATTT